MAQKLRKDLVIQKIVELGCRIDTSQHLRQETSRKPGRVDPSRNPDISAEPRDGAAKEHKETAYLFPQSTFAQNVDHAWMALALGVDFESQRQGHPPMYPALSRVPLCRPLP